MIRFSLLCVLLLLVSRVALAGVGPVTPPVSLPSEQDSVLSDCISNGISLGLSNAEIDSACPANRSPIPFTNNRINQISRTQKNAPGSGNGDNANTASLNDVNSPQGLNAGVQLGDFGFWANVSHTNTEYSLIPWDAQSSAFTVGAHKDIGPSGIMGISFGLGGTEVDTLFNGGEQEMTDYSLSLYASTLINNTFSVGANAGYIFREMEQFRTGVGGTTPFALGERVIGGTESDTWFASANLDGYWQVQAFSIGAHSSVLYSSEDIDGFTETGTTGATNGVRSQDNEVGVLRLGFDVGYTNPGFVEPYFGLDYLYYFDSETVSSLSSTAVDNDDTEFVYTFGARFYRDNLSAVISYSNNFSREFMDYDTLNAVISIDL